MENGGVCKRPFFPGFCCDRNKFTNRVGPSFVKDDDNMNFKNIPKSSCRDMKREQFQNTQICIHMLELLTLSYFNTHVALWRL